MKWKHELYKKALNELLDLDTRDFLPPKRTRFEDATKLIEKEKIDAESILLKRNHPV